MSKTANKKSIIVEYQTVITALGTYPGKSFVIAGKVWSSADLVKTFQAVIDAINAGNADKIVWQASVAKEKSAKALARPLYAGLRVYLAVMEGKGSNVYKTFGFAPAPATPNPVTKVEAAKKSVATRKARGTLGKKQRKAIKGVVAASQPAATGSGNGGSGTGGSGTGGGGSGAGH